ncbi:MAG: glycosyltransferase family 4 protein [Flammeovirgaceae bacterium]|nr:glycosyltransferase family 4 protein [Flammeovirgaceae bacterium]
MKRIASSDVNVEFDNSKIIPNGIDSTLFKYVEKNIEQRKRILLIRSFNSRKYAVDIAINAILELSEKPFFNELTIELHGKGYLFKQLTAPLTKFKNIFCYNTFLRQEEIAEKHKQFGIFLSPTRQDAQGVSMCEAMASGLVPITSSVTAIPEFVKDGVNGCTTKSAKEIAERIEYLYANPAIFSEMSQNATEAILKKCSVKVTMPQEIELIESLISAS